MCDFDDGFEASGGFSFGLAFAGSSGHVVLGGRAAALAGDGDEVEGPVELTVATSIQPIAVLVLTGGDLDGCGAAVAAWGAKGDNDYVRPISMIRYMGGLGQSSDPDGSSYHPDGLQLVDGLIEVVTEESSAPGERHERLARTQGEIAIYAWTGDGPATIDVRSVG